MAWEISISAEGWSEIREQLETWPVDSLIAAICDDKFEAFTRRLPTPCDSCG